MNDNTYSDLSAFPIMNDANNDKNITAHITDYIYKQHNINN